MIPSDVKIATGLFSTATVYTSEELEEDMTLHQQ